MEVRPCRGTRELRLFEELPERLHGRHSAFAPPLPGSVVRYFQPGHAMAGHVKSRPYLAWRGNRPVGRIASIRNDTHNRMCGDRIGFFGFFDFPEDPAVAEGLLDAVRRDPLQAELRGLRGPYDLTANGACGVLTEGFDEPAAHLMRWNPPHYEGIYRELDLRGVRDLYTFEVADQHSYLRKLRPLVRRARRSGFSVRRIDSLDRDERADALHRIFNETLREEWGFMPMTRPEWQDALDELAPILDPGLVTLLEREGALVGFCFGFPDPNEWLRRLKGIPRPLRYPLLLWFHWTRTLHRARFAAFGILGEARGRGAWSLLFQEVVEASGSYPGGAEISWIQDVNQEMLGILDRMGPPCTKVHRIYQSLPRTGAGARRESPS